MTTPTPTLPVPTNRLDYTPPAYWIDHVALTLDLDPIKTRVLNTMQMRRNLEVPIQALRLDGEELSLSRVLIDGKSSSFKLEGKQLVLDARNLPDAFTLEIFTICQPQKNTQLMGLYVSGDAFFTQCEAQGFRRITYYLDRPDVMASFVVALKADKKKYPVLLSNGNLTHEGDLPDGRHFAVWIDPHKKPAYLFALVAGIFVCKEQRITSMLGKEHTLQIYVRHGDLDKTEHAMNALMASVAWDEARFGLSLDLERFMVVATSDFNMGAMENKGLNIFNTRYVLANAQTATDVDFANVESVVAHEYFHNWTGNRVTCRDWFQLSLKEGLTVFRDQEFSQDMAHTPSARAVKRIEDVCALRSVQFAEDSGTMAHPVRPEQYLEISNFYTATIYEKGAEVVRMIQTLVGADGFKRGMALYFAQFDGMAVTCDDFVQSIADANPNTPLAVNLSAFKLWYSQTGTPKVSVKSVFDAKQGTYTLHFKQHQTTQNGIKNTHFPLVIPVKIGLLGLVSKSESQQSIYHELPQHNTTVVLTQTEQSIVFHGFQTPDQNKIQEPIPSLLRGFSAPIVLDVDYTDAQLLALLAYDTDAFNRWEAGQRLATRLLLNVDVSLHDNPLLAVFTQAMSNILQDTTLDAAFQAVVLTMPSHNHLMEQSSSLMSPESGTEMMGIDPIQLHKSRTALRLHLAKALLPQWQFIIDKNTTHQKPYKTDAASMGERALFGMAQAQACFALATETESDMARDVTFSCVFGHFTSANNMTNRFNALSALVHCQSVGTKNQIQNNFAEMGLNRFFKQFQNDALVIDKWFALQASVADEQLGLTRVQKLMQNSAFNLKNPNRARSVIFTYCMNNPLAFHRLDGEGYIFWATQVLALDAINPQVAARLARALDGWRKWKVPFSQNAQTALLKLAQQTNLSQDVKEIIQKAMA